MSMNKLLQLSIIFIIGLLAGWVLFGREKCTISVEPKKMEEFRVIYAMGDSLTAEGTYVNTVSDTLGTGWVVKNKGIGGHTTSSMLSRFTTDVTSNADADYVIIWAGINDIDSGVTATTTKENLQAMYNSAHAEGIKVIVINIAQDKGGGNWTSARQLIKEELNAWIKDDAENIDYFIDAYSALGDPVNPGALLPAYDGGDHIHLSKEGYELVGKLVARKIN